MISNAANGMLDVQAEWTFEGGSMRSFVRSSGIMAAVAIAGAALTAAAPAAQAQAVVGTLGAIRVPCSTDALAAAINTANSGGGATLSLAGNCTYTITTPTTAATGLPAITGYIGLMGGKNTVISRSSAASTAFRILDVAAGGALRLIGISVRNGSTSGLGGGIQNAGTLLLNKVVLSGNTAGNGGGLANLTGATANVIQTVFDGNTTTGVGGGGIINSGSLTLLGSSFSGNTAPINGGGLNTQATGTSRIVESVFERNVSGGLGGGMSNLGTTSLDGTLVRLNTGSGGGGIATGNNNVTLSVSIVSNNIPDNCNPLNTIRGCVN
jgi:hypothetical protein